MHKECQVCRSEGFIAHTRVLLMQRPRQVIATLYHATGDLIGHDEAGAVRSRPGRGSPCMTAIASSSRIRPPLNSLSHLRSRIYGHELGESVVPRHHRGHRRRQVFRHSPVVVPDRLRGAARSITRRSWR